MIDKKDIFNINSKDDFEKKARQVFKYQFENNSVYRSFCDLLYKHPSDIKHIEDIPFLPIEFFKSHQVLSASSEIQKTFISSGTTGSVTSKHFITDLSVYQNSFRCGFQQFYGDIKDFTILALLPSYMEREGSSLIYMMDHLIAATNKPESGFYLDNIAELIDTIERLDNQNRKVLLIGVSFALLDLVESHQFNLKNTIIMETGGMKGRRKELIRAELHAILKRRFGVNQIHSEYGMTELLSQAYSSGNGVFNCPNWMQVFTRDTEDALTIQTQGKTGGLNIIDLANINSCSFIATQDLARVHKDGSFEVLGRFDTSDIRGCNLMIL